ncbi:hypothetical protein HDU76_013885, partial [Blyttiomyces sp. JEL0837]
FVNRINTEYQSSITNNPQPIINNINNTISPSILSRSRSRRTNQTPPPYFQTTNSNTPTSSQTAHVHHQTHQSDPSRVAALWEAATRRGSWLFSNQANNVMRTFMYTPPTSATGQESIRYRDRDSVVSGSLGSGSFGGGFGSRRGSRVRSGLGQERDGNGGEGEADEDDDETVYSNGNGNGGAVSDGTTGYHSGNNNSNQNLSPGGGIGNGGFLTSMSPGSGSMIQQQQQQQSTSRQQYLRPISLRRISGISAGHRVLSQQQQQQQRSPSSQPSQPPPMPSLLPPPPPLTLLQSSLHNTLKDNKSGSTNQLLATSSNVLPNVQTTTTTTPIPNQQTTQQQSQLQWLPPTPTPITPLQPDFLMEFGFLSPALQSSGNGLTSDSHNGPRGNLPPPVPPIPEMYLNSAGQGEVEYGQGQGVEGEEEDRVMSLVTKFLIQQRQYRDQYQQQQSVEYLDVAGSSSSTPQPALQPLQSQLQPQTQLKKKPSILRSNSRRGINGSGGNEVTVTDEELNLYCGICATEFERGDMVREFKDCKHRFHRECGDVWFRVWEKEKERGKLLGGGSGSSGGSGGAVKVNNGVDLVCPVCVKFDGGVV